MRDLATRPGARHIDLGNAGTTSEQNTAIKVQATTFGQFSGLQTRPSHIAVG